MTRTLVQVGARAALGIHEDAVVDRPGRRATLLEQTPLAQPPVRDEIPVLARWEAGRVDGCHVLRFGDAPLLQRVLLGLGA